MATVCLCQRHELFGTEIKLGVRIPWDVRVLCTYSMGTASLMLNTVLLKITEVIESLCEAKGG